MRRTSLHASAVALAATCAAALPALCGETTIDLSRPVFVGDGFTAGNVDGTLFDGASADPPVPLGQQESFAVHVGAAVGADVVFPRIAYPGLPGRNQVVLKEGFCAFDSDAFLFLLGTGGRVDPFEVASVVAVPEQTARDAVERRWSIDPQQLSTVDTVEDLLLGLPGAFVGAQPASQIETAARLQPTVAFVWLGTEDVLGAARRGDASLVTPPREFRDDVRTALGQLEAGGARLVIANVPDPTVLPYFMGFAELKRYLRERATPDDPEVTSDGLKVLFGVRRRGYVLRTYQTFVSIAGINDGFQPAPLHGGQRLDPGEVRRVRRTVRRYNRILAREARQRDAVLVDLHALFRRLARRGADVDGTHLDMGYLGGLIGLDGIYPTGTGHALIAAEILRTIDERCGTSLGAPDVTAAFRRDPLTLCANPSKHEARGR